MVERLKNKLAIILVTLGIGILLAISIFNGLVKEFFLSRFFENLLIVIVGWVIMVIILLLAMQYLQGVVTDLRLSPMEKSN